MERKRKPGDERAAMEREGGLDGKRAAPLLSRRGFAVTSIAVLSGLVLWKAPAAFADEPWWDGSYISYGYGHKYDPKWWGDIGAVEQGGGGVQSGTMYTDRWVAAKTPWVEWDLFIGAHGRQLIRVATKISMQCDFTTELYYHLTGRLEIACGSFNSINPAYNLWHTDSGDDTRFSLYHAIDDQPAGGALEEAKIVAIDNESGAGLHRDGAHVWTDYRSYGTDYDVWVRREPVVRKHSFQLRSWFWNYYYYGTDWYFNRSDDPPIGFSTKWIEQHADLIYIDSALKWSHRILEISPVDAPNARLECPSSAALAGSRLALWSNRDSANQNFCAFAVSDERMRGTLSFTPAHSGTRRLWLDHAGGGPTRSLAAAHLWMGNGDRAQAFWVHGDGDVQWLFADCSGLALDRANGSTAPGTECRFHSSGYPADEWANVSHQWHLADAVFRLSDGGALLLEGADGGAVEPGSRLSVSGLKERAVPRNVGSGVSGSQGAEGVKWEYSWIASDEEPTWASDAVEVVGEAFPQGRSSSLGRQIGTNLIGTVGQGAPLASFWVRLEGSALEGTVEARARSSATGTWSGYLPAGSRVGGGRPFDRVSFRLTGETAKWYDVAYRASAGGGWGPWARNGAECGATGSPIEGVAVRVEPKSQVPFSQGSASFVASERLEGKWVVCAVRAVAHGADLVYRGMVASEAVRVGRRMAAVRFFVDGEASPCWVDNVPVGERYTLPREVKNSIKLGCAKFKGWYWEKELLTPVSQAFEVGADGADLYGVNVALVKYAPTDASRLLFAERTCFMDKSCSESFEEGKALPENDEVPYGTRVVFKRGKTVWFEDRGAPREVPCSRGAYATADGLGSPSFATLVVGDMTAYLGWSVPLYDGVEVR